MVECEEIEGGFLKQGLRITIMTILTEFRDLAQDFLDVFQPSKEDMTTLLSNEHYLIHSMLSYLFNN